MLSGSLVPAADTRLALQLILQIDRLSLVPPRAAARASDCVRAHECGSLLQLHATMNSEAKYMVSVTFFKQLGMLRL